MFGILAYMRVYVSADMEGIACVSAREEVKKGEDDYVPARAQMTAEVAAACNGAFEGGAASVVVKDSHWTGRNLDAAQLSAPEGRSLRIIRGWSGHPFSMVQGLDESFQALAFVGYHSAASRGGNPLAHTLNSGVIARLELNGKIASEFLIFSYAASLVKVPAVFLAGDKALCEEARRTNETIVTVETMEGFGASITTLPPSESVRLIREGVARAVKQKAGRVLPLPADFHTRLTFTRADEAYRKSFYPGATLTSDLDVTFETKNYFDVLRFLKFMTT
jgi:D-amino peptidase